MRRIVRYVLLVLVIAVGSIIGSVPARGGWPPDQAGAHPPRHHPAHSAQQGTIWAPAVQPVIPSKDQPVRDYARKCNFACWTHHNQPPGCSSLVSELRFIFGSCRSWYGESCPNNAPSVPIPHGPSCPGREVYGNPYVDRAPYAGRGPYTDPYGPDGLYAAPCPGCP